MNGNAHASLLYLLAGAGVLYLLARRTQVGQAAAVDVLEGVTVTAQRAAAAAVDYFQPRGIRNHNPANLRDTGIAWQGLADPRRDTGGFLRFADPVAGLRAAARDLLTDFRRDKQTTVRAIISEFAPPNENNTGAYIEAVAKRLKVLPDDYVNVPARLPEFLRAIVAHENGAKWENHYTAEQYAEAARRALA